MEHFFVLDIVDQDYLEEIKRQDSQVTNGECLKESLCNINLRTRIHQMIGRNTLVFPGPCLNFDYVSDELGDIELEQSDIKEVCEVFGKVLLIEQKESNRVLVMFNNSVDCFFAQRILNCHHIQEINLQLLVRWASLSELQEMQNKLKQKNSIENFNFQFMDLRCSRKEEVQLEFNNQFDNQQINSYQNQYPPKFTCRYEIQIAIDDDFQVARKIIGSKGCNMKKIIDQCSENHQQVVKLRLRGKGSGYREGPMKQESNEPLHLCVSSKSNAYFQKVLTIKYQEACALVEKLLQRIYDDYSSHFYSQGKKPQLVFFRKLQNCTKSQQSIQQLIGPSQNSFFEFPPLLLPKVDKLMIR